MSRRLAQSFMDSFFEYYLDAIRNKKDIYLYLIHCETRNRQWYFFDVEMVKKTPQIMWVPRKAGAFKFRTEEAVEEFRSLYVSPRKTEIIRLTTGIG